NNDPAIRYRIFFGRNENWNIAGTIIPAVPSAASLNLESAAAGAEIQFIPTGRWHWTGGVEYSHRTFQNLSGIPEPASGFFTRGSAISLRTGVQKALTRFPERRFTVDS